jgi:hypothetical protein
MLTRHFDSSLHGSTSGSSATLTLTSLQGRSVTIRSCKWYDSHRHEYRARRDGASDPHQRF